MGGVFCLPNTSGRITTDFWFHNLTLRRNGTIRQAQGVLFLPRLAGPVIERDRTSQCQRGQMKVTHDKRDTSFQPVTIHITCECQQELDALGLIFNHLSLQTAVSDAVEKTIVFPLDEMKAAGARLIEFQVFNNRLKELLRR
jgi:hypothetical protein